jgi:hypothetical protein
MIEHNAVKLFGNILEFTLPDGQSHGVGDLWGKSVNARDSESRGAEIKDQTTGSASHIKNLHFRSEPQRVGQLGDRKPVRRRDGIQKAPVLNG